MFRVIGKYVDREGKHADVGEISNSLPEAVKEISRFFRKGREYQEAVLQQLNSEGEVLGSIIVDRAEI